MITQATVKVMRSYDYCHFEISLTNATPDESYLEISDVDTLRKEAARLADKAVEQYKLARTYADHPTTDLALARLKALAEMIQNTPERDRTPEEQAILKSVADRRYAARRYDYQDDWGDNENNL